MWVRLGRPGKVLPIQLAQERLKLWQPRRGTSPLNKERSMTQSQKHSMTGNVISVIVIMFGISGKAKKISTNSTATELIKSTSSQNWSICSLGCPLISSSHGFNPYPSTNSPPSYFLFWCFLPFQLALAALPGLSEAEWHYCCCSSRRSRSNPCYLSQSPSPHSHSLEFPLFFSLMKCAGPMVISNRHRQSRDTEGWSTTVGMTSAQGLPAPHHSIVSNSLKSKMVKSIAMFIWTVSEKSWLFWNNIFWNCQCSESSCVWTWTYVTAYISAADMQSKHPVKISSLKWKL